MDERMRFVIRLKDGETMAALCREFSISRKTGYKIFARYEQCGLEGASIESSEIMNLYSGNVVLGDDGTAQVELPAWFEALNQDFRYQLTPIGGPAPGLYIAQKISRNSFKIGGGSPGSEVSWQVTGLRHDVWARTHPLKVEEDKPDRERGTYLDPELFGQPLEKGLAWLEQSEAQKLVNDGNLSRNTALAENDGRAERVLAMTAPAGNQRITVGGNVP